ncbi:hypothetical protein [Cobetia sp. 29-18-1]|uniref:hypothetical protein n=1 Tax=Cobetia sp. 29-18-1 TaxID=3040018 RepID=UPI0024479351|nr:hypothetical protein [Cobetia sp. 29-18-1]MDH2299200.1 hypothetical protein [Cobetia sp. 29-18-1]
MEDSLGTADTALFDQVTLLQKLYIEEVEKHCEDSQKGQRSRDRIEAVAALSSPVGASVEKVIARANRHKHTLAQTRELLFAYEAELDGFGHALASLDDILRNEKVTSKRLEGRIRLLNSKIGALQSEQESERKAHVLELFDAYSSASQVMSRRKARKTKSADYNALLKSSLFDADWYLIEYTDVATTGLDPIKHYLNEGAREGRNPSTQFDTIWYLTSNPDVVQAGMNPLLHYLRYGKIEGRLPLPNNW